MPWAPPRPGCGLGRALSAPSPRSGRLLHSPQRALQARAALGPSRPSSMPLPGGTLRPRGPSLVWSTSHAAQSFSGWSSSGQPPDSWWGLAGRTFLSLLRSPAHSVLRDHRPNPCPPHTRRTSHSGFSRNLVGFLIWLDRRTQSAHGELSSRTPNAIPSPPSCGQSPPTDRAAH